MRYQICSLLAVAATAVHMRTASQTNARQGKEDFSLASWFAELDEQLTHVNLVKVAKQALMSAALDKNVAFFDELDKALPNFDLAAYDVELKDVNIEKLLNDKEEEFVAYCASFGKSYTTTEEFEERFGNWLATDFKIKAFNKENWSFTMAQNDLSTWTKEEKDAMLMPSREADTKPSLLAQTKAAQPVTVDGTFSESSSTEENHCEKGSGLFKFGPEAMWECVECKENCKNCDFSLAAGGLEDMDEMIWNETCIECDQGFVNVDGSCVEPEPEVVSGCKSDEYDYYGTCYTCAEDVPGCVECTLQDGKAYVYDSCDACGEGWQLTADKNCEEATVPVEPVEPEPEVVSGCKSDEYDYYGTCYTCAEDVPGCVECTLQDGKAYVYDSCDVCGEGWQLTADKNCEEAPEPVEPVEPVEPSPCPEHQYYWINGNGNGSCWDCKDDIAECATCTNQPMNDMYVQTCDTCNSGFELSADRKSCNAGGDIPEPVAPGECAHGYHKNEFGTCILSGCPEGQWSDDNGNCQTFSSECDGDCAKCFTSYGECKQCKSGFSLNTATGACQPLDPNCAHPYGPVDSPAGCLDAPASSTRLIPAYPSTATEVDWRKWGVVNEIKSQGSCGSCWSFGGVAPVETNYAIKYGPLHQLSEQHLVDCDTRMGGCNGGDERWAMNWFAEQNGPFHSAGYPYQGNQQSCKAAYHERVLSFDTSKGNYLAGVEQTPGYEGFKASLRMGVVSIGFHVESTFQQYGEGIFDIAGCPSGSMNHAMAAVGYGVENGQEFAIIRNSWGSSWGEGGYARVAISAWSSEGGVCDVHAIPAYPHLA